MRPRNLIGRAYCGRGDPTAVQWAAEIRITGKILPSKRHKNGWIDLSIRKLSGCSAHAESEGDR